MMHSQFGQDKFLNDNIFHDYKYGIFVDVGAHDGITYNNTLMYSDKYKWNGYNIEPIPSVFELLEKNRPNCVNLNCAVSDEDGMAEFILNTGYTEMLSGLKKNYDNRHISRLEHELATYGGNSNICNVETKRLSTIFKDLNIKYVNYLSIDVEGAEMSVLKSIDFDKVFIDVIEFENNYKDKGEECISFLKDKGYELLQDAISVSSVVSPDIFMVHNKSMFNK